MTLKYSIIDTPDTVTSKLPALKAAGVTAIVRYDDPSGNPNSWKQVGMAEYHAILNSGISVAIVSEWGNNHAGYFNAAAGRRDAQFSVKQADLRQQPKNSAIYFAADYDALPNDMANYIKPYFQALSPIVRAAGYRVGCYGSGYVCSTLHDAGLIDLRWITCSSGFAGSRAAVANGAYDLWQVFGLCDQSYLGLSVDWDSAHVEDWGQVISGDQPPPPVVHGPLWMQGVLREKGFYHGTIDAIVGPLTIAAMIAYMESKGET